MQRRQARIATLTALLAGALGAAGVSVATAQEAAATTPAAVAKRLPGLEAHLSEQELESMRTAGVQVTAYHCGCYDRPNPHFPYALVIVKTSQRELVARPEGQESATELALIAVRQGAKYCQADAGQPCFGEFASPCEFTDFRYGALLVEYFPTCKTERE